MTNQHITNSLFLFLFGFSLFAQTTVKGTIFDEYLEPLAGITIKSSSSQSVSDFDGNFTLQTEENIPFFIQVSAVGYKTESIEIANENQSSRENIRVILKETTFLDDVVVSASRTPERIMESPVTIERFDSKLIKNTSAPNFYDALENLKGIDLNRSSLSFKSINTRGFAAFENVRFVQLVDGMDTATPELNFSLGNISGINELDVENIEILPGAASALYGANAFNGIIFINSKNPFDSKGVSAQIVSGMTNQKSAGINPFFDTKVRFAHPFNDKFAIKANFSLYNGEEWHATDYRNSTGFGGTITSGDRAKYGYDGINIYGDEIAKSMRDVAQLIGAIPDADKNNIPKTVISRQGYTESDLTDYRAENIKLDVALHYRPSGKESLEIMWNSKYADGNTIYQGQNRYMLQGFSQQQHKLEVKGTNFFVRGYSSFNDSGDSFNSRFAAININRGWKSDKDWFGEYVSTYYFENFVNGKSEGESHRLARIKAESGRVEPGSPEFQQLYDKVTSDPNVLTGSKFKDKTGFYHADANLNMKEFIDWAEVQVGGSYRLFSLNSSGSLFTDYDKPITYDEYGLYTQIQKKVLDNRLKFTGSVRYDKSTNFNGNYSPRISISYASGENRDHNFRASFQTGFRNPTAQEQYIGLFTGNNSILGTAPDNLDRYQISVTSQDKSITKTITGKDAYEKSFTASSVLSGNPKKSNLALVQPERVQSFEVGYRGVLGISNKLLELDVNSYFNRYIDPITNKNVLVPLYGGFKNDGTPTSQASSALQNGDFSRFSFRTNSTAEITSFGAGIGLNTKLFNGYEVGANYTYATFNFDKKTDPEFEPGFNTPKHSIKIQFGHPKLFTHFGFNINARWQDSFYWQSPFLEGNINARTVVDAQMNYKIPSLKSRIKLGGTNLTGNEYFSAIGTAEIGSIYYLSLTFND